MSLIENQIRHARRRLTQNVLFEWLTLGVLVAAGLWALSIVTLRLAGVDWSMWHGGWVALILAGLVTLVGTMMRQPSALRAAVVLDEAAGSRERLSTGLVLARSQDPFARAAVHDAEKLAGRIHVPTHIRHRSPQWWPWSATATLAALILAFFLPPVDLFADRAEQDAEVPREVVEAEREAIQVELERRIERMKQLAQNDESLKDITEDLEPLEMPDDPGVTPEDIRREAVKRIDDVRDKLQQQLETSEQDYTNEVKRMLSQLQRQKGNEATSKLAESLAAGDFQGAREALQQLAEQIQEAAEKTDDPAAQQKLQEMQEQFARLADQLTKLSDTAHLQKELTNKAGLSEKEAEELLKKLANTDPKQLQKELQKQLGDKNLSQQQLEELAKKIQQNQQARQACQNLAKQMAKASQACQQCNSPGSTSAGAAQASNALSNAMSQMSQLEMTQSMMSELQANLSDLENFRDNVCRGGMCPNWGDGRRGQKGGRMGQQGPNYGLGLGERIGKEKTPHQLDPTKARTRYDSGTIIGTMLIDGPQIRGEANAEVLGAAEAEMRDATDAIERQDVPRQYNRVLQEYFERLAGLIRERQGGDDTAGEAAE